MKRNVTLAMFLSTLPAITGCMGNRDDLDESTSQVAKASEVAQATEADQTGGANQPGGPDQTGGPGWHQDEIKFIDKGNRLVAIGKLGDFDDDDCGCDLQGTANTTGQQSGGKCEKRGVRVKLKAVGIAKLKCDDDDHHGKDRILVGVRGHELYPSSKIDHKKLRFEVKTNWPDWDIYGTAPSSGHGKDLVDVKFKKAILIVERERKGNDHDNRKLVVECRFKELTHDGVVPDHDVRCKRVDHDGHGDWGDWGSGWGDSGPNSGADNSTGNSTDNGAGNDAGAEADSWDGDWSYDPVEAP